MNFLNQVVMTYPDAVSFGPGRPLDAFSDVQAALALVGDYAEELGGTKGPDEVYRRLGQYGATNGCIREEISRYLASDEGFDVAPDEILVTVGCQEGILIALIALFDPARDVLLIADPAYVGMSGPATMLGVRVRPVPQTIDGLDPNDVAAAAAAVRADGYIPRALYHVPTFNNPLGTVMTIDARRRLLEVAVEHDLFILEDNSYGAFAYDADPPPTLASMDRTGRVIYLSSFSKTLFPGLRVGFMVHRDPSSGRKLMTALGRVKSFSTINTSPIMQAVVAGILRNNGNSLRALVEPKRDRYRQQRDQMLASLTKHMTGDAGGVSWNRPGGGFFLAVTLPFAFDDECVRICAQDYGVICSPMRYFTSTQLWNNVVRLSYSYVTPAQIEDGIARLARFVASRRSAL